jgi:hypothetical protein
LLAIYQEIEDHCAIRALAPYQAWVPENPQRREPSRSPIRNLSAKGVA